MSVLRRAADDGDALLSRDEAVERVGQLDLAHAVSVPPDWISGNRVELAEEIDLLDVSCEGESDVPSLQLVEHRQMEDRLRSILRKRAAKPLRSLGVAWADLLREAIAERSPEAADRTDDRYEASPCSEQADALERITTRRLSVLVGQAGTGKTTVLSALLKAKSLVDDGVLFLAPTGKASVQIAAKASGAEVRTVAAFLYSLGRYDGRRQRPLLTGTETYASARTVVVDESSMLTMEQLGALLAALDLAHVQRLILVGDPNQLPPIGVGRPFADLVAHLDATADSQPSRTGTLARLTTREVPLGGALARLTTELRTRAGERRRTPSDSPRGTPASRSRSMPTRCSARWTSVRR